MIVVFPPGAARSRARLGPQHRSETLGQHVVPEIVRVQAARWQPAIGAAAPDGHQLFTARRRDRDCAEPVPENVIRPGPGLGTGEPHRRRQLVLLCIGCAAASVKNWWRSLRQNPSPSILVLGQGSTAHGAELLQDHGGLDIVHVPTKGRGPGAGSISWAFRCTC